MSIRKMASIQKILDIQPIKDADAIEVATINSWKVVVAKKDGFKIGDLVVYCEVDSWIPHSLAPFLSKSQAPRVYEGVEGERLKTVRLRGQISQGLIISLGPVSSGGVGYGGPCKEGEDLSELLGIVKYDPPVPANLAGTVKGSWPSQVPKTDEERIQNLTNEWSELQTHFYEVTEKVEGSSMSVGLIVGEFFVGSRNLNLKETEGNTLWSLARKYDIENKMINSGFGNIIIQGEVIGEGVQGNHYGIKGQDFYVYSIYDIEGGFYYNPSLRRGVCETLGLKHVPVIDEGAHFTGMTIAQVLEQADGQSAINPKVLREGEVFKRIDGQEHFKAVSNKYLLKTGG